jgi:hypothetical protein
MMSITWRAWQWIIPSICLAGAVNASRLTVYESPAEIYIVLSSTERAGDLYNALDVVPTLSPGECYAEMECIPPTFSKSVVSGSARLTCTTCQFRPCGAWEYCIIDGHFGAPPLGFSFEGEAAQTIGTALDQVGNPFMPPDGSFQLSCTEGTCPLEATIVEYWIDYNTFFYALHEYGDHGRTVLRPLILREDAQAFYDIFNVPEEIQGGYLAVKRLRAGALDIVCNHRITGGYYGCTWDVPYSGTLPYPVDVTSTLAGADAVTLYEALDLPGPTKVFETSDALYSTTCTQEQCDIRLRRPAAQ